MNVWWAAGSFVLWMGTGVWLAWRLRRDPVQVWRLSRPARIGLGIGAMILGGALLLGFLFMMEAAKPRMSDWDGRDLAWATVSGTVFVLLQGVGAGLLISLLDPRVTNLTRQPSNKQNSEGIDS